MFDRYPRLISNYRRISSKPVFEKVNFGIEKLLGDKIGLYKASKAKFLFQPIVYLQTQNQFQRQEKVILKVHRASGKVPHR